MMLFCLFLQLVFHIIVNAQNYDHCLKPFCDCYNLRLICTNFTSFKQLEFKRTNSFLFDSVEIIPSNRLNLDNDLNFNGLHVFGTLLLSNIKSFTPFYNPFKNLVVAFELNLFITNSTLELNTTGLNHLQLIAINSCNNFLARHDELLFSSIIINEFRLCNVEFTQQLCPIVFSNAKINVFTIISPTGSFFGFRQMNGMNGNVPKIKKLALVYAPGDAVPKNLAKISQLNSVTILNRNLFSEINALELNRLIYLEEIEATTFKYFTKLKKIEFYDINLKRILDKSRTWIKNLNIHENYDLDYLNLDSNFNRERILLMLISTTENWSFNNEDICSFKYFPHDKLVYPLLLYTETTKIECNCAVYYLYKYFDQYKYLYQVNPIFSPTYCFENVNYQDEIKKCNFEKVIANCKDVEEPTLASTTAVTTIANTILSTTSTTFTTVSSMTITTTARTTQALTILTTSTTTFTTTKTTATTAATTSATTAATTTTRISITPTKTRSSTSFTTNTPLQTVTQVFSSTTRVSVSSGQFETNKTTTISITSIVSITSREILQVSESRITDYLKQTRARFYAGIALLVIAIVLIIVLILVAYKTFYEDKSKRYRTKMNKNFPTPSLSVASIDYEDYVIERH